MLTFVRCWAAKRITNRRISAIYTGDSRFFEKKRGKKLLIWPVHLHGPVFVFGDEPSQSPGGRGSFRDEPSQSPAATALPKGEPLAEPASFVHTGQRQKKSTDKPMNFTPLPKPPPSGEVARRSRDGEGFSPSRCARQLYPFLSPGRRGSFRDEPSQSPAATALPKGEPLAKRESLILIGQLLEESDL